VWFSRIRHEAIISGSEQLISNKLAQKIIPYFLILFLSGCANFILMLAQALFFRNWLEQQNQE